MSGDLELVGPLPGELRACLLWIPGFDPAVLDDLDSPREPDWSAGFATADARRAEFPMQNI